MSDSRRLALPILFNFLRKKVPWRPTWDAESRSCAEYHDILTAASIVKTFRLWWAIHLSFVVGQQQIRRSRSSTFLQPLFFSFLFHNQLCLHISTSYLGQERFERAMKQTTKNSNVIWNFFAMFFFHCHQRLVFSWSSILNRCWIH